MELHRAADPMATAPSDTAMHPTAADVLRVLLLAIPNLEDGRAAYR
jgi:hypothetical protein